MAKVGRNAPCPCGSGKKYKKCCLKKDEAEALAREPKPETLASMRAKRSTIVEQSFHPYVAAKMAEDSEMAAMLGPQFSRFPSQWTPSTVAALTTEELETKLRELGVDPSRDAFLEQAEGQTSAWDLSRSWVKAVGDEVGREVDALLGLGACALWKRYLPERPSVEMLDDLMTDGYDHHTERRFADAADRWIQFWEVLSSRMTPEMTQPDDAQPLIIGSEPLAEWLYDVLSIFRNAAIADSSYAERGIAVLGEVPDRFPDWGLGDRLAFRAEVAHLHFLLGHDDVGEELLTAIIEEEPSLSIGYVSLADELADHRPGEDEPRDLDRAITLLEQALERPVIDSGDWSVEERLEELRRRRSTGSATPTDAGRSGS